MAPNELLIIDPTPLALIPKQARDSLAACFTAYVAVEAGAGSDNTLSAKKRDLQAFLSFFEQATGGDDPDQWTRSLTGDFVKSLERAKRKPATINRVLATLRHAAGWIEKNRKFIAGNPCDRIADVDTDDPEWRGLSDMEITRLKAAAEQLLRLKTGKGQQPIRDYAIFQVLLRTGLRVSELLRLDFEQYCGKHFVDVKRKGRKVSREIFLAGDAREALDSYVEKVRGKDAGPLFCSKSGARLARQNVDEALKVIAAQANSRLGADQKIKLHAHVLRHTCLRRAAEKHGVQYAMEIAGHTSERYIWRYVQPSKEQKEAALEKLF